MARAGCNAYLSNNTERVATDAAGVGGAERWSEALRTVAIQGIRGSYSEEAAVAFLGVAAELIECCSFGQVFNRLEQGLADCAVIPVENSIVGKIAGITELLTTYDVVERERFSLNVDHVLAGVPGTTLKDIHQVTSHAEALKQCQGFLSLKDDWSVVIGGDTASCIRKVADDAIPGHAAIGSRRAAKIYGAEALLGDIADAADNTTTFCLITNKHRQRI